MNILHLIIDDKFFNFIFKVFSDLDHVENKYVAIIEPGVSSLTYINELPLWRVVGRKYVSSSEMQEDLEWCDVLIVHFLHTTAAEVILKAPHSVKVVWSGWGGDYYNLLPGGETSLLGDDTAALIAKFRKTPQLYMRLAEMLVKKILKSLLSPILTDYQAIKFAAIKRVDYFSSPIPDDYLLLKCALGDIIGAAYVQLNYGSVEDNFSRGHCELTGNDILLGNSASATNNHLEAMRLLSSIELGDRKIVVPLSYGDEQYADAIERYGADLLGEKFIPIRKFMALDEYSDLISRCSVAIMNHRRQQAMGTIGIMLYRGVKLFMDHRNVVYKYFKQRGASVFSIQDIGDLGAEAFSPISCAEKKKNIQVLESIWGHEVVMDNARKFVKLMQD